MWKGVFRIKRKYAFTNVNVCVWTGPSKLLSDFDCGHTFEKARV